MGRGLALSSLPSLPTINKDQVPEGKEINTSP
jgi:hypothetical protein